MKARILFILPVLFMAGMFITCNAPKRTPIVRTTLKAGDEVDLEKTLTINVARRGSIRDLTLENMFSKYLQDRFNVILNITDIAPSDYITRMNLMFAAGETDDLSLAHRPDFMLSNWIEAGYLLGFTQEQVEKLLPNFISHYTPEAWPVVWDNISYTDGLTYYFPGRRAQYMNMAWLYREDIFNKYGLTFPDTTDELFDVLMKLKEETGMYPIVECDPQSSMWAFTGYLQAFGMPELALRDISMIDPITGDFEPFIFTTDNYRRFISFLNKLYKNDLMWPEFATGTHEQRNSLQARGHRFIMWGFPEQIATQLNEISRTGNQDANWKWAPVMITEDTAKGHFYKRDPYFAADGIGFSVDATDEVVERFLYILNWLYSEEGLIFATYGLEGVHFERQGSDFVFLPHMATPLTPVGHKLENFGFIPALVPSHHNLNDYYRPYIAELQNTFINRENYYFHTAPILRFTERESTELADIQTILAQTREEYSARFVMGHLDVNDDAVWDSYVRTMNQLGLQKLKDIRNAAYGRKNR